MAGNPEERKTVIPKLKVNIVLNTKYFQYNSNFSTSLKRHQYTSAVGSESGNSQSVSA